MFILTFAAIWIGLVVLLWIFSIFYKPGYPTLDDVVDYTTLDHDGWEYREVFGKKIYKNGPHRKGYIKRKRR